MLTFESFRVDSANRFGASAARRAADAPGRGPNPLFLHGPAGSGKTHLLRAIAERAGAGGARRVLYLGPAEALEMLGAGAGGTLATTPAPDLLLLDDVHELGNQAAAPLPPLLGRLVAAGTQVVLASQVPPEELGELGRGLLPLLSTSSVTGLGPSAGSRDGAEEAVWAAAQRAEAEGFVAERLWRAVEHREGEGIAPQLLAAFEADLARLRWLRAELERGPNPWSQVPEGALRDPDRLPEAEAFVASLRERQRAFAPVEPGDGLEDLDDSLPGKVLDVVQGFLLEELRTGPLFLWSDPPGAAGRLGCAAARTYGRQHPGAAIAWGTFEGYARDLERARGAGVIASWRERWWSADLLFLQGLASLEGGHPAEAELLRLLGELSRRGAPVLLAADRPAGRLKGLGQRALALLEGGVAVEVMGAGADGGWEPPALGPENVVWRWPRLEERIVEFWH